MNQREWEFEALAGKALGGEAATEEKERLNALLEQDPARKWEFRKIEETFKALREAAPLVKALNASEPGLPEWRLNELKAGVRAEFGGKDSPGLAGTLRRLFSLRLVLGGGLALAVLVCLLVLLPRQEEVELGLYRDYTTRGVSNAVGGIQLPHVKTILFDKEADFENWWKGPFNKNQKARVWIDEETDTIHVLRPDASGNLAETTLPRAATPGEQKKQLEEALQSLK